MYTRACIAAAVLVGMLPGCAELSKLTGQESPPPKPSKPYLGLAKGSYGVLRPGPHQECQKPIGSSQAKELAGSITSSLLKHPLSVFAPDESIVREELQRHFPTPANPSYPTVSILERNQEEITFWFQYPDVKVEQITKAAGEYCGRIGRHAADPSTATFCPPPSPIVMRQAGQPDVQIRVTYVIANAACLPGAAGRSDR